MSTSKTFSVKKGFGPIILIIAIAAVMVGIFLWSKNQREQRQEKVKEELITHDQYYNWKTYNNRSLGFSIRYPKEWYIREYGDYAANFTIVDPQEATPGAIRARFIKLSEKIDLSTFERIYNLAPGATMYEPLDVVSIITKIRNFDVSKNRAVEYSIDRNFSALEGPKTEHSHAFEIEKGQNILQFTASATTKEEENSWNDTLQQMIASIKF